MTANEARCLKSHVADACERLGMRWEATESGHPTIIIKDAPESRKTLKQIGVLSKAALVGGYLYLSGASNLNKIIDASK